MLTPFKVRNVFRIFERRLLRMILGFIDVNDIWMARYRNELYTNCDELDVVKVIQLGRLRWVVHCIM